jgi:hypothetical protein
LKKILRKYNFASTGVKGRDTARSEEEERRKIKFKKQKKFFANTKQ